MYSEQINGLVSVVIPTYNRANLLKRAIESCLEQTYKNIEVIVVDDGSQDNTQDIIESIKDKRIKYIKLHRNFGPPFARNIGITNSKGEFIAFLDSDDYFLPQKIEKQLEVISKNQNTGLVYCDVYLETNDGLIKKDMPRLKGYVYNQILHFVNFYTPTILVRKSIILSVGLMDETKLYGDDMKFVLMASKETAFDFVPEPLCVINRKISNQRLTLNIRRSLESRIQLINERKKDLIQEFGKAYLSFLYSRIAYTAYKYNEKTFAVKILFKSFIETKNFKDIFKVLFIISGTYDKLLARKYGEKNLEEFSLM